MTVLALLRHAKAVKDDPGGDHARALSDAGRAAAALAGQRLQPLLPESALVVASDSRRTWQTAELAFPTHAAARLWLEPSLYLASASTLLSFVQMLPRDCSAAVLVGHNPGLSEFAALLAGHGDEADLARLTEGLATADAVVFEFPRDWPEIAPKAGRLTAMLPRKGAED